MQNELRVASLMRHGTFHSVEGAKPVRTARAAATSTAPNPPQEPVAPGTVRVTYVQRIERDQIPQQVKAELIQAANNGAATRSALVPEPPSRRHLFGDLRPRGELDALPKSNAPQFQDFATIDSGSLFDLTGAGSPVLLLDTTHDMSRERPRTRVGVDVDIDDCITAELRVATGNDASPVTPS